MVLPGGVVGEDSAALGGGGKGDKPKQGEQDDGGEKIHDALRRSDA